MPVMRPQSRLRLGVIIREEILFDFAARLMSIRDPGVCEALCCQTACAKAAVLSTAMRLSITVHERATNLEGSRDEPTLLPAST